MKGAILISIFGFCCLANTLFAQSTLYFEDNFDDNSKEWGIHSTNDLMTQVQNGKYYIEQLRESGANLLMKQINYSSQKDFIIEAKIRQVDGTVNSGFGIIWDAGDRSNAKCFTITAKKYYNLYDYRNGMYHSRLKWTKNKHINRFGKENIIKIQRKGTKIYYYVNGEVVCTDTNFFAYGSRVGIVVNKKMTVEVDYIRFYQDDWVYDSEINLVEMTAEDKLNQKENLGANINSKYSDRYPIVSPDGEFLYFIRTNSQSKEGDKIWSAYKSNQDTSWSQSYNVGAPLNNEGSNIVFATSSDNNTLYLGGTYKSDGSYDGSGISITHRTANGWQIPKKIQVENLVNYNRYVTYFITPSRKIFLAAIQNDNSYGGQDLFVYFEKDGAYVNPINLGPNINTIESEFSPFLAPDGKTLYFASYGWPGYGDADIFVSKRLDDSWTNWSKPKNMGFTINTPKWDGYYTIPASGEDAYIVSSDNSFGDLDIFRIKQPEKARPEPVLMVYGKVLNSTTNQPVETDITYYDLATGKEEGFARSNPHDGSYKIILPYGKKYSFLAYKDTYYSISDFLDVSSISYYDEIERNLYLNPIKQEESIQLNNLFFENNQAKLEKESSAELDRLAKLLKENPDMKINVDSYINTEGSESESQKLSRDRAEAVVEYLVEKGGIDRNRLTSKGHAESKKVEAKDNKQQKRTMEFTILPK